MSKRRIIIDGPWRAPLIDWFAERIGHDAVWHTDDARVIAHVIDDGGVAREENVLCVVLLNHWTPTTCEANIASDGTKRWFSREFARNVYSYVFEHGGRSRINFTVSPDNTAAVTMHEKLGHKREALLEDAYGEGRDAILYGYTKRQWIKGPWYAPQSQ
jgi:hypothetical protein